MGWVGDHHCGPDRTPSKTRSKGSPMSSSEKFSSETEMRDAVFERFGTALEHGGFERKYAAREVSITAQEAERQVHGDCRFDAVEYDKEKRVFRVIELKLSHHQPTIREAFAQVAKYRQALTGNAHTFLDAFTRKSPMRFGRLMESTCGATEISVEFYVGLTDEACKENRGFLSIMKDHYPDTGIARVKSDGRIKHYIKNPDGTHDYETARARAVSFPFTWPQAASASTVGAQASVVTSANEFRPKARHGVPY
jgi:hypothetical protein